MKSLLKKIIYFEPIYYLLPPLLILLRISGSSEGEKTINDCIILDLLENY